MPRSNDHHVPLIFWPFAALWGFLAFILKATGRLIGVILGLVLMLLGFLLTMTVIGAFVGIPLMVLGFLLVLRSLF